MPEKKIEIALKLSEDDWAEVYYALESKQLFIQRGFYECLRPDDVKDNKKLSAQLSRLGRTLKEQFRKHKVVY